MEDDCNYIELIDMVVSEIRLDSREVAITMKYILNKALLPICIEMKVIIWLWPTSLCDCELNLHKYDYIVYVLFTFEEYEQSHLVLEK